MNNLSVIVKWSHNLGFVTGFCIWPVIGFVCPKYMLHYNSKHLISVSVQKMGLIIFLIPHLFLYQPSDFDAIFAILF